MVEAFRFVCRSGSGRHLSDILIVIRYTGIDRDFSFFFFQACR